MSASTTGFDLVAEIVDGTIIVLSEYSTEALREVLAEAESRNADTWLAQMIREYLDVWRS